MSIKYKILMPLQLIVFITITAISYLYITNMQESIKDFSLEKLKIIASTTNEKVNLYIHQQEDKVTLFNTRKFLHERLVEYKKEKNTRVQVIIQSILEFSYSDEENIVDIVILDSDSNIIASKSKKITANNTFIKNLNKIPKYSKRIELVFETPNTIPLLYISAPILQNNVPIGTSIFIIRLNYLNTMLTNTKYIGKTGEMFMGVKHTDGFIIFTPLKEIQYPKICLNKDLLNYIFIDNTIEETTDYRGEEVVISMQYNQVLQAIILVKQDINEIMNPLEEVKHRQLLLLSIGSFFILLSGLIISGKMIRIIENVVRITSNIADGKLHERIDITTNDELGTLSKSVNKMADFMLNVNRISEAKVVEKTKQLQESNENLSSVIKSLSHDIKTPLTIIGGYLEEMEDGLVKTENMPYTISVLKKETAYLNELSSEAIGYIQSKEITANLKEILPLKIFLTTEVFPLLPITGKVELKCECDTNQTILFNPTALKKILINLLDNANKYTKNGYITIKFRENQLIVEDTGIGIDPQYSKKIFEPFYGLDNSRNREKNGFGLGLCIAQNLAEANGYELTLDNTYKNGCRFILKSTSLV